MTEDETLKELIEDLISAMEYHVEQTRQIHSTTVALQAARETLKSLTRQRTEQEPVGWLDSNDKLAEFMHKDLKAEHDKRDSSTPRAFQIPVYTTPPQRKPPQFPTMLRKMWSGREVQDWINENWNKGEA